MNHNEMRGLSVREQAEKINEEAIDLIKCVMQKHTAAMLEAMKEKVTEQREKARELACQLDAAKVREAKLLEALEIAVDTPELQGGKWEELARSAIYGVKGGAA